jgi:hypothetical protein
MRKAHRIIVPVLSGIVLSMILSYWPSQLDPGFIAYGRTVNAPQAVVLKRMIPSAAKPGSTFIARLIQYIGPGTVQIKTLSFEDAGITARVIDNSYASYAEISVSADVKPGSYAVIVTDSLGTRTVADFLRVELDDPTTRTSLPPLAIPDVEAGPIKSGYVIVTADTPFDGDLYEASPVVSMNVGIVHNGVVQSQAAIVGASQSTTLSTFGIDIDPDLGRNFGIAIASASRAPSSLSLTLLDDRGAVAAPTKTIPFAEFSQISNFVTEMFPSDALGTAFKGSLIVSSAEPFIPLGLRFNGPYFFPVSARSPNENAAALQTALTTSAQGTSAQPTVTVFPQFALGGGWATQLSIVDNSGRRTTGMVAWFDPSGKPIEVTMNGETASVFSYTLPPSGSFLLAPRDSRGQTPF